MVDAWYNTTNFTTQDSYIGILHAANDSTAGLFGTLVLLGFFVVLLLALSRTEVKNKLTVSAWVTAIIGIVWIPLGIINTWVIYLMIILFVIGFVGLVLD
jgi:hypothetical protein